MIRRAWSTGVTMAVFLMLNHAAVVHSAAQGGPVLNQPIF